MKVHSTKNPWLGLESYKEGEILYGRDDDIRNLSLRVLYDTCTLLYGKSGIGKSSLLNAGILPVARMNGFTPVTIRLSHKDELSYLDQIKQSIKEAILSAHINPECNFDKTSIDTTSLIKEIIPSKQKDSESFYEFFHRHTFHDTTGQRISLLIIFDQFEELLTLQEHPQKIRDFFSNLADLLNDIMPEELQNDLGTVSIQKKEIKEIIDYSDIFDSSIIQKEDIQPKYIMDNKIHFVFSIREDFLAGFEYHTAKIPLLKQNRYGLRPINEEQAAQIIMRPVSGLVDKEVAKLIIERITNKKDFQLDNVPEIEVDSAILSLYLSRLYEIKTGETITKDLVENKDTEIISDFYKESISCISNSTIEYLEDALVNDQGCRDNISIYDAINKGNISKRELEILCNEKKILRIFNYAGNLRIEYIHDRLCPIILKNKLDRKEKHEQAKQSIELKKLKRQRLIILIFTLLLISMIGVAYMGYFFPVSHKYATFAKEWGYFTGVGRLTDSDASYVDHYILKKRGYFRKHYSSMEKRNRYNQLTPSYLSNYLIINSYDNESLAKGMRHKLSQACKWEIVQDPINKLLVLQERAYDKDDNLIYTFNYNALTGRRDEERRDEVIGSYVDEQGLPLDILKEGYRFVKITYDNKGRDILTQYYDIEGNPSTNADGAYQTFYEYNELGLCTSMSSLNKFGVRMIDRAGNCGMRYKFDGYNSIESISIDDFGEETLTTRGYSKVNCEYDKYGRESKTSFYNKNKPINNGWGYHQSEIVYDDVNNKTTYTYRDILNNVVEIYEFKYDKKGNLLHKSEWRRDTNVKTIINKRYDTEDSCIYERKIQVNNTDTTNIFLYEKELNYEKINYYLDSYTEHKQYNDDNKPIEIAYYEIDGKKQYEKENGVHKVKYTYENNGLKKTDREYCEIDSLIKFNTQNDTLEWESNKRKYTKQLCFELYTKKDLNTLKSVEFIIDKYNNTLLAQNAQTVDYNTLLIQHNVKIDFLYRNLRNNSIVSDTILMKYMYPIEELDVESNEYAVFIECFLDNRRWNCIVIEDNKDEKIWNEKYRYENFKKTDKLKCLNLLTMQVEEYGIEDVDYWRVYFCPISNKLYNSFKGSTIEKIKPMVLLVDGTVMDDGFLAKNTKINNFFVLKWSDWDCSQTIEEFSETFNNYKDKPKDIVLLPYEIENGILVYKKIVHLQNFEGLLGARIDYQVNYSSTKSKIKQHYNNWQRYTLQNSKP